MIVVEVDGQKAKLIKGKWGGNEVLAPTLESLGIYLTQMPARLIL